MARWLEAKDMVKKSSKKKAAKKKELTHHQWDVVAAMRGGGILCCEIDEGVNRLFWFDGRPYPKVSYYTIQLLIEAGYVKPVVNDLDGVQNYELVS